MKRKLLMTIAFIMSINFYSFSLSKGLQGPEAKNYKPWRDSKPSATNIIVSRPNTITGPEAKNKRLSKLELNTYPVKFVKRRRIKSFRAKNHRSFAK